MRIFIATLQNVKFALQVDEAKAAVAKFEAVLSQAAIPADAQAEIAADLQTIKAQLLKPSPSLSILREVGKSARNILEGLAAGIPTPGVLAAGPALWTATGL
ncbi:MAG: hypothetical protein WBF47_14700 [Xanthobacteraceae bacterium]|jgi:hypothetical protein